MARLRGSRFHESPMRSLHGQVRCVPADQEVLERPIEIMQDLLLGSAGEGSDLIERGPQNRQLTAWSPIVQPPPPDRAQFAGEIIGEAADASEPPEQPVLPRCRRQLVAQAAMENHSRWPAVRLDRIGCQTDSDAARFGSFALCALRRNDKQGRARFLSGLKTGASARD
jgi:hypothetical protein